MPTIPPGLPAALQSLDHALDAPRRTGIPLGNWRWICLLYTSDAADE